MAYSLEKLLKVFEKVNDDKKILEQLQNAKTQDEMAKVFEAAKVSKPDSQDLQKLLNYKKKLLDPMDPVKY